MRDLASPFEGRSPFGERTSPLSLAQFAIAPSLLTLTSEWDVVFGAEIITINGMPEVPLLAATFGSEKITVTE